MALSATEALMPEQTTTAPAKTGAAAGLAISLTHRLADVEATWRDLSATGIDSPGQSFDFIRLWVEALGIAEADQFYVTARQGDAPIALVPLWRRRVAGVRVLSWFPGTHVGCNAPLIDVARLSAMTSDARRALWRTLFASIAGADLVHLRSMPQIPVGTGDVFAELGQSIAADMLYRASFPSFDEADKTQRNKSRRKHDRQQGDKLEAMGTVSFESLGNGEAAVGALETMFRQRAARFAQMGVVDPFAAPAIRAFYASTARENSGVRVKLHLLRLEGEIVAMRYSVVHGDRLFCLISSMSEDAALRPGSPGKQCLLRVMQTMFDEGLTTFDMGEGLTDEKRHWCNVQIPVSHHYAPITRRGALAASLHRGWQGTRARVKSDPRLLGLAKTVRAMMLRARGQAAPAAAQED